MTFRTYYRTEVAGIPVKVKHVKTCESKFKALGGKIIDAYDKGLVMEFPTQAALDEFKNYASVKGAIFDQVPED